MGRPSVYTSRLGREICAQVEAGLTMRVAARAAGIGRRTLYNWLTLGREGREPYAAFAARLERAQGLCEARIAQQVYAAGAEDWRAAAWMLERRFPRRWSSRQTVQVERPVASLTDEELEAELGRLGYVRREPLEDGPH
jgi:hypothetical protein